jgi:multimeric flavodoxin WrbA
MTEHGWPVDDWPAIQEKVMAADILVIAGPIHQLAKPPS